jgi:hypothetical protein
VFLKDSKESRKLSYFKADFLKEVGDDHDLPSRTKDRGR